MTIKVIKAVGHHVPEAGKMMFDGRIKFPVNDPPDAVNMDGWLYQRVEPHPRMTPEDYLHRETR